MPSLVYTTAQTTDLQGIIELQQKNLAIHLTPEAISTQGFVTVVHSLHDLKKMNHIEPHIICKDGTKVVAYLLSMTVQSQNDIPVLKPMFEMFRQVMFNGKTIAEYNYMVVGQVCVDKAYRGAGILDKCYDLYRDTFKSRFDFAITEIATRNTRSIKAHERIGFIPVHQYTDPAGEEWSIVVWNW
ncbi:GNAT family N-acetyltransferase [Ferruginibacter sp.]